MHGERGDENGQRQSGRMSNENSGPYRDEMIVGKRGEAGAKNLAKVW